MNLARHLRRGLHLSIFLLLFLNTFFALFGCWCGNLHFSQSHAYSIASADAAAPVAAANQPTLLDKGWQWLLGAQASMNRQMAETLRSIKSDPSWRSTLMLVFLAFAYGVLHAVGPGHGKAVISSYVLSNDETVRRGIVLSFLSGLFQAVSAILFVGVLLLLMRHTGVMLRFVAARLEILSWVLIACVGSWMLWKQGFSGRYRGNRVGLGSGGHVHSVAEELGHSHGADCACGHAHMPAPQVLNGAWSWRRALPIALAIGIRPCTGALLLLTFAIGQGMLWAGILGTFAMAVGTAISVSVLASFAVSSRYWAMRIITVDSIWSDRFGQALSCVAALIVILLGVSGAVGTWSTPRPFGL